MNEANTSGDSSELEALFDSIAEGVACSSPAAQQKDSLILHVQEGGDLTEDSKELEDLFDSVAKMNQKPAAAVVGACPSPAVQQKDSLILHVQEGGDLTEDSRELEELFDLVAKMNQKPAAAGAGSVDTGRGAAAESGACSSPAVQQKDSLILHVQEGGDLTEDSKELEELFDSVAKMNQKQAPVAGSSVSAPVGTEGDSSAEWSTQQKVFDQVGHMVRQLHETLKALGYDQVLQNTVDTIPDARERLSYISNLTEKAASRVLNATDVANPILDELEEGAVLLGEKWDSLYANRMSVDDFKLLANDTREFLRTFVPQKTHETRDQLLEIMMAQDFQDLTGQVIKKLIVLAQSFESQLMGVLLEAMPGEKKAESVNSMLNGPVINPDGRRDVVANQEQVDDLLDSLGF